MLKDNKNIGETMDAIEWTRRSDKFERILGKYILIEIFEHAKGPNVLDVGCGDGSLTGQIAEKFEFVVGIDPSPKKIAIAERNNSNVEFVSSMLEDYKTNIRFSSIIMVNILEHVDDPVIFLKKAKDMLTENGQILIFVPNALSLNRRIGKEMGMVSSYYELSETDIAVGHQRFYDKEIICNDILKAELIVVNINGIFLKPLSNKQMEEWDKSIYDALFRVGKELPDYCGLLFAIAKKRKIACHCEKKKVTM